MNKRQRRFIIWIGIGFFLAVALSMIVMATFIRPAHATHCGLGLASEDLSGSCRLSPVTPGALEAVGVVPDPTPPLPELTPPPPVSQTVIVGAIWSADIFSDGAKGFDNPWNHCAGRQGAVVCRVVVVFELSGLPDRPVKSVKLRLNVVYVSPSLETSYWTVGHYIGDPRIDVGQEAFERATCPAYILKTSLLRTTGVKNLAIRKAIVDVQAAIKSSRTLTVFIKSVAEDADRFVAIGRYNESTLRPALVVTFK